MPESLLVLGGGASASRWRRPTPRSAPMSTLIEGGRRILAKNEEFASEQVADALRELRRRHPPGLSRRPRSGRVTATSRSSSRAARRSRGATLLVAVGRRPRVDGIGLESVGIEPDGYLEVDDQMRVDGSDWLYAIGDVNGRALLTHMGKYQGRLCADHIARQGRRSDRRPLRGARRSSSRSRRSPRWARRSRRPGRPASTRAPSTWTPRVPRARASSARTSPGRAGSSSTRTDA